MRDPRITDQPVEGNLAYLESYLRSAAHAARAARGERGVKLNVFPRHGHDGPSGPPLCHLRGMIDVFRSLNDGWSFHNSSCFGVPDIRVLGQGNSQASCFPGPRTLPTFSEPHAIE